MAGVEVRKPHDPRLILVECHSTPAASDEGDSGLKSLCENTQPLAIEPQNFDQITPSSVKDIYVSGSVDGKA